MTIVNENEMEKCPKCGDLGIAHHIRQTYKSRKPNKLPTLRHYLQYIHKDGETWKNPRRCYLGRVETLGKSLTDLLEKQDLEKAYRLEKDRHNLSKDIREYFKGYSPNSSRKMVEVEDDILTIMEKWGF